MYSVSRKFTISCAHKLVLPYESKCNHIHGHNYEIEIQIFSEKLDSNGMIIDFSELKQIENEIKSMFDHKTITSNRNLDLRKLIYKDDRIDLDIENSTCENLAKYIADFVFNRLKDKKELIISGLYVTVSESSGNKAGYYMKDVILK